MTNPATASALASPTVPAPQPSRARHVAVGLSLGRWNSWNAPLASIALLYLVAAVVWLAIDPARRVEVGE